VWACVCMEGISSLELTVQGHAPTVNVYPAFIRRAATALSRRRPIHIDWRHRETRDGMPRGGGGTRLHVSAHKRSLGFISVWHTDRYILTYFKFQRDSHVPRMSQVRV